MKKIPERNMYLSEEFNLLLRYAYDELNELHAKTITSCIRENIELELSLKGILQIKKTNGFINSQEHLSWINRKKSSIDQALLLHQKKKRNLNHLLFIKSFSFFLYYMIYVRSLNKITLNRY